MFERLKRLRFFVGRLLSAQDFQEEQDYLLHRLRRHNRIMHGSGVVTGLQVSLSGTNLNVRPGIALDCEGHEIIVDAEQTIATPSDEGSPQFLVIHYQENNVDPISPLSDNDMPQASHIEEGFLLAYESNDAFGHVLSNYSNEPRAS